MSEKQRIVFVDDEPDIMKVTLFRLQKAGYEVVTAVNGEIGLDLAKTQSPDLIILDLNIPGLSGEQVCVKLKADENLKKIPVLIMSASAERVKDVSERIGADGYILKPYEHQELISKIKTLIRQ